MNILARIFRFLFWLLVLSWAVALLGRFARWMLRGAASGEGAEAPSAGSASKRLVRDPVCGMHVAEQLAIAEGSGNEMVHFCSAQCRDIYLQKTRRMAASA
jgi:YHS domain-containing protein